MDSTENIFIVVSIVVPMVMALFAKAFSPTVTARPTLSLETLKPKFAKWEAWLMLLYMSLCVMVAAVIWLPFKIASDFVLERLGPAWFSIAPGSVFWLIPATFLAFAVASFPATWIVKRLMGAQQFEDFETYLQLKHNMDYMRVNRLVFVGVYWLVAASVALGLNWYVLVRADAFVFNPFFSIHEIAHPYSDIQAIQTAPQFVAWGGNVVQRQEFLVIFRDGSTWSTLNLPLTELSLPEKRTILDAVSALSGVPIEELEGFGKGLL